MTAPARVSAAAAAAVPAVRIGYVLGAFPVLSETFVSGEVAQVARAGALGPVFVFDPRAGLAPDPALVAHLRPVAGLATAGRWPPAALARALWLTRGLPLRGRASLIRHAGRIARAALAAGATHLHAHFGGGAALHGLLAARLAGLGFSLTLHSGAYARDFDTPAAARLLIGQADAVVGATEALAATARAEGARRAVTIACGADLDRFRPIAGAAHNGRLLALGRLIDCKGIDTAISALAGIDGARRPGLDIVGAGPEQGRLAVLAARLGVAVRFLGPRPNDWVAAEAGGYMALVAPFRHGRDGQVDSGPVVLKEALALGLPVITTDLPGPAGIVADAGEVVPADHPAALALAIARTAALTPAARQRVARRARARAGAFGLNAQAAALIALAAEVAP